MTSTLSRRYHFSASHRLHSSALDQAENSRVYGKCNNPYGHGHDYVLDVSITGEINATTGLILRLSDLDHFVKAEVLDSFAHRNLNIDVAEFSTLVPTTENVAIVIADRLRNSWKQYFPYSSAHLSCISLNETERNGFQVLILKPSPPAWPKVIHHSAALTETNESVIVNA